MDIHARHRRVIAALLTAAALVSLRAAPVAQAEDETAVVRLVVDTVIPAAAQDFASLKGSQDQTDPISPRDKSWSTTFVLPEDWYGHIHEYSGIYRCVDVHLWIMAWKSEIPRIERKRGDLLVPLYKRLRALLSAELKAGWKRKSENDNSIRPSQDDFDTGSETIWTRKDGLRVRLARKVEWSHIYKNTIDELSLSVDVEKNK
jgi:hypothetical protein